jgi:hypothetical protein
VRAIAVSERNNSKNKLTFVAKTVLWSSFIVVACWQARSFSERIADGSLNNAPSWRQDTDTDRLFQASFQQLESLTSLSADIEFESSLFGNRYFGRGKYKELSSGGAFGVSRRTPFETKKFLLDATLSSSGLNEPPQDADQEDNFLTIVCDCDALVWWKYSSINGQKELERINFEELWRLFQQLDPAETEALRANGVPDLNCGLNGLPGLGGLLGQLRRAYAYYEFGPTPEVVETRHGDRLYRVVGEARPIFWEAMKSSFGVEELDPVLSEYLPSRVEIYFDTKWSFPCKFAFYSLAGDAKKPIRHDVFTVSYLPNTDPVAPEEFKYVQPQRNSKSVESEYLAESIYGIAL